MPFATRLRSGVCSPLTRLLVPQARSYATAKPAHLSIQGQEYKTDKWTNVTPTVLSKVERNLHLLDNHPLSILRQKIESHFSSFKHLNSLSPIVTVQQNFDDLGFAADHPGRSLTDSYYVNEKTMLRTHTSAHEVELFRQGNNQFLLTADVYRRDEIDRSHYPVFHQVEGCNILSSRADLRRFEKENAEMRQRLESANIVISDPTLETTTTNPIQHEHTPEEARIISEHLKNSLNSLVLSLFGDLRKSTDEPLQVRWIEATFPWTAPSYEVEVLYDGKWLEILGCGVVKQQALNRSGESGISKTDANRCRVRQFQTTTKLIVTHLHTLLLLVIDVPEKLGWAFGLGLERIAMVLFSIPDIRLFWSQDRRFLSQFTNDSITTFKPYSKYPECYKDFSFWTKAGFHENDFCEIVRDVAGDLVEGVQLIDEFIHPKTHRRSVCYRMNYRSMDRSLSNEEVNEIQAKVVDQVVEEMGVEVR